MRILVVTAIVLFPFMAVAQTAPTASTPAPPADFPADASAPPATALRDRLAGKVIRAQPVQGPGWRIDMKGSGWAFIDLTNGGRDTGRWRTEDGKLCFDWQRFPSSCSEVRVAGERVLLKRTNGEIVAIAE